MMQIRGKLLGGVLTLSLLGIPPGAQATQIGLDGTTGGITLTGTGALLDVSIAAGTGGGTHLNGLGPAVAGNYVLGVVSLTAGPNTAGQYPVTVQSPTGESFTYSDSASNALTGVIHWIFLQDSTPGNPQFSGSMTVLTSSGSAAFTGIFIPGSIEGISLNDRTIPGGLTLDHVVSGSDTVTVGIAGGHITDPPTVPGPGLPGFAAAVGVLALLVRRRKAAQI